MTDVLIVLLHGQVAGRLERRRGPKGDVLRFVYDEAWLRDASMHPLSLSLPRSSSEHDHDAVSPYVWGLLPDNERVVEAWAKRFQVSAHSAFALLAHVGEDCAGAVQFVREERVGPITRSTAQEVEWLTEADIAQRLRDLRENETAWRNERDQGQFSLAGAQPKTALLYDDGRWGIPQGRLPTTHILKPPLAAYRGHTLNEHLCLELARAVGLPAARSEVRRFEKEVAIVVERYDRAHAAEARGRSPQVVRLHQEDLCQALAIAPAYKYQNEGGPTPARIAKLLRDHSRHPREDVFTFVDALAFNWILGGTDAHAKNYSLLHGRGPVVRLAPLYDVASALPYPELDQRRLKLAMKVGKTYALREVTGSNFQVLAREVGLAPDEVVERVYRLCEAARDEVGGVRDRAREHGLATEFLDKLTQLVSSRAEVCRASVERTRSAPTAKLAQPDPALVAHDEYTFQGMRVVGNRLVAELSLLGTGERVLLDPYRPGRNTVAEGDRVRFGPNQSLMVLERGVERGRGR
ncbi:MAG TPA: type II toxin-antitoxin system HipA family toxin [Polyangiales bacterium]|nr:type II toxin-antitoxin system HipA family toxin [Polyangiales bacterium]